MPINRETGKDRWKRIPKDYFKALDGIQVAKLRLSALAAILALGWAAVGFDWMGTNPLKSTDGNSLRANHGTLARVHATWDNKCDACHVPFEPIDGRPLFATESMPSNRSGDRLCVTCHAGSSHHASMIESETKACAGCHRDHQGRDFSMVRLLDQDCTNCHSSLENHIALDKKPPGSRKFKDVARFNKKDHPSFEPEAAVLVKGSLQDRSKLKFNHALHMTKGLVAKPGQIEYTAEKIPMSSARGRYQGSGQLIDPVQLDCSSCHQLDSMEATIPPDPSVAPLPRTTGRYYLPIRYENHCQACHTLTFDSRSKEEEAPHGVQPPKVVEFLEQRYARQILSDDPKLLDVFVPPVRLPGKSPVATTARKRLDEAVTKASTFLFQADVSSEDRNKGNCLECHYYGKEMLPTAIPNTVEPTKVPKVWFTHASFNHTPHRGVSCRECHSRSYPFQEDGKTPFPEASHSATDVLIPAIDNCVRCHAPAEKPGGLFGSKPSPSTGGASFDCTECHRYHDGDRTLGGSGMALQDIATPRTIAEFLQATDPNPGFKPESPRP